MNTLILLVVQLMVTQSYAGEPSWSRDLPKWSGHFLTVSCRGVGPDRDLAYRQAMDSCRSIATEQISGSFKVLTLSVESEQSAGFHQEVEALSRIEGVVCDTQKSFDEELDGSHHVYLQCKFDKTNAKVVPAADIVIERKKLIKSKNKSLIVSTVPHCESLIIRGTVSRMVRCESNPQTIAVGPSDKEILVRAKGYRPAHVDLSEVENILEVYLESN